MRVLGSKKGVLLLGHGSKLAEANETLKRVASRVKEIGGFDIVLPAFLQLAKPDIQEAADELASKGFDEIIVMPYFLYSGAHVTADIPGEIEYARKRHPGLRFSITENLGFHDKLIEITLERIGQAGPAGELSSGPAERFEQHPIEKESFRIIGEGLEESGFSPEELSVVKRVIHSTADFDFKDTLRFSTKGISSGISAIREGRPVITDVKMIEAGISKDRLFAFGARLLCFSSDEDVIAKAKATGITKTAASMRKAAPYMEGGIVAIGNAPTALTELLRLVKAGKARPSLIVGVPVGFVGAVESKEELMRSGVEHITCVGRKGGSTVAVAIVNALAIEAIKAAAGR